jgi:hypothetical protein
MASGSRTDGHRFTVQRGGLSGPESKLLLITLSTLPRYLRDRTVAAPLRIERIIFAGDRGMITKAVADKIKGTEGLHTISALNHRQIVELLERKVITVELLMRKRSRRSLFPKSPSGATVCVATR